MRVIWALAKVAHTNDQIRALRAFTLLTHLARGGQAVERKDLVQAYTDLGISRTTAWRDIKALRGHFHTDSVSTPLVVEIGTMLRPRSFQSILDSLGMMTIGYIPVELHDMADFQTWKDTLYLAVAYGCNRNNQGGTTVSRLTIQKLTGRVRNTQRAIERRRRVVVQPNIAEVMRPDGNRDPMCDERPAMLVTLYGKRQRSRVVSSFIHPVQSCSVQIRNTYFAPIAPVSKLGKSYQIRGDVVHSYERLSPEHGQWSLRQTFTPKALPGVERMQQLLTHIDVDVQVGHTTHLKTGETYGLFMRMLHVGRYNDAHLAEIRDYALQSGF